MPGFKPPPGSRHPPPGDQFMMEDAAFFGVKENDFDAFIAKSTTPDFSDLVDVLKPTAQEIIEYGHQAEEFIVQCSFDKRNCTKRLAFFVLLLV